MYYYVYDSFLNDHKYSQVIKKIEARLTDLGIFGKGEYLSLLKDLSDIVRNQYRSGTRNFIAVGNDRSFLNLINAVADLEVTVGYIPIGSNNYLGDLLGLARDELACDVLSARIVKTLDLGQINNNYFLTSVRISGKNFYLNCDDKFDIVLNDKENVIEIVNFNDHIILPKDLEIDPDDKKLNIVVKTVYKKNGSLINLFKRSQTFLSFFTVGKVKINKMQNIKAVVDECRTIKPPIEIKIADAKIKLIVGKARKVLL